MSTSVGKIVKIKASYYDSKSKTMKIKSRPAMIVRAPDSNQIDNDYIVLPISKISHSHMIDTVYDIKIEKSKYPNLKLYEAVCYIRTHKQVVVNENDILLNSSDIISDLKIEYIELYEEIFRKMNDFQENIVCNM